MNKLKTVERLRYSEDAENLDPPDWDQFRKTAHGMLDDMIDFISGIRNKRAWSPVPAHIKQKFLEPAPENQSSLEQVYKDFWENVLPYNRGNIHPRFWGWVDGAGTPSGILYEMLAATMNCNTPFGDVAAVYIEMQIIRWFASIFGMPGSSFGSVTSGASAASFSALAVARSSIRGFDVTESGLNILPGKLRVYCSSETHNSIVKAVQLLGLGRDSIRWIPVDADFRIDTGALRRQIITDKENGDIPFCLVGNLATVNTGAIDSIEALAQIAKEERLWLHIDAAFGVGLAILPEFGEQLAALKEADSVAFDFHKWLSVQYDAACVIVRNAALQEKTFHAGGSYLMTHERGIAAGPPLNNTRLELSRGFKNLKIWMAIKENGLEKYRTVIRKNLKQAGYLKTLIQQAGNLELMAPVETNVVTFRYNPSKKDRDLDTLNKEIVMRLQEDGKLVVSGTVLTNQYVIRAAITNHRSEFSDFDLLVAETIRWGSIIEQEI